MIKIPLYVFSLIYAVSVSLLIFIYRLKPYRPGCKVVSIGNITLGGTGKTPLVEYVARYLKNQGKRIAIVSRGYKKVIGLSDDRVISYEAMGDEAYMLQEKLRDIPVIVNKNRKEAIKEAIEKYNVDTVILDDAFQQWKIKKDLEIVTIDAANPFGNRRLIPAGILRQPLSSLGLADIFVLTKTDIFPDTQEIKNFINRIKPSALIFESWHQPVGFYKLGEKNEIIDLVSLKAKGVVLVSGIAAPESFEKSITGLGINIGSSFRFPDHHNYTKEDLDRIIKACNEKNINTVITTEKDAVKLSGLAISGLGLQILVLRIELKITQNEERLLARLSGL